MSIKLRKIKSLHGTTILIYVYSCKSLCRYYLTESYTYNTEALHSFCVLVHPVLCVTEYITEHILCDSAQMHIFLAWKWPQNSDEQLASMILFHATET